MFDSSASLCGWMKRYSLSLSLTRRDLTDAMGPLLLGIVLLFAFTYSAFHPPIAPKLHYGWRCSWLAGAPAYVLVILHSPSRVDSKLTQAPRRRTLLSGELVSVGLFIVPEALGYNSRFYMMDQLQLV